MRSVASWSYRGVAPTQGDLDTWHGTRMTAVYPNEHHPFTGVVTAALAGGEFVERPLVAIKSTDGEWRTYDIRDDAEWAMFQVSDV